MESNQAEYCKDYVELMKEKEHTKKLIEAGEYFRRKSYKLRLKYGTFLAAREAYTKEINSLPAEVRRYNEQLKKNN